MSMPSTDLGALDEVRVQLLGKKGLLTEQLKSLGALPPPSVPLRANGSTMPRRRSTQRSKCIAIRLEQAAMQAELAEGDDRCHLARPRPGAGQPAPGDAHALADREDFRAGGIRSAHGAGGRR